MSHSATPIASWHREVKGRACWLTRWWDPSVFVRVCQTWTFLPSPRSLIHNVLDVGLKSNLFYFPQCQFVPHLYELQVFFPLSLFFLFFNSDGVSSDCFDVKVLTSNVLVVSRKPALEIPPTNTHINFPVFLSPFHKMTQIVVISEIFHICQYIFDQLCNSFKVAVTKGPLTI